MGMSGNPTCLARRDSAPCWGDRGELIIGKGKAASPLWLLGKVVTADGTASLTWEISTCWGSQGQNNV